MKKLFGLVILSIVLVSCNNAAKQDASAGSEVDTTKTAAANVATFELDSLLAHAENYIDKPIKVTGYVTHTCKHSGRRCFLAGESQKFTVRVEAKGDIGGFNRELIGSKIEVDGILRENRLSPDKIDAMEKAIDEKKVKDDGSAESCDAETANVKKMREWMKENGKDYYAIYYIDGESYNEIK